EVELVEGAGDVEVGVGVEAVDEAAALIAQVALDLELHVEGGRTGGEGRGERGGGRRGGAVGDLAAAEFAVHGRVGEVGDVGHHAGDGQADARAGAGGVVAVVLLWVLHDGLTADLVEGDGLRAFAGGGGHGDEALGVAGKFDAPLEHLHAAHGAADDGVERRYAEGVEPDF